MLPDILPAILTGKRFGEMLFQVQRVKAGSTDVSNRGVVITGKFPLLASFSLVLAGVPLKSAVFSCLCHMSVCLLVITGGSATWNLSVQQGQYCNKGTLKETDCREAGETCLVLSVLPAFPSSLTASCYISDTENFLCKTK